MKKKRKNITSKKPNPKTNAKNHTRKKKAGKKTTAKERKRTSKNGKLSGKARQGNISKKSKLPSKKYTRKTVHKGKVSIQTQRSSRSKKRIGKKAAPGKRTVKKIVGKLQARKQYFPNYSQIDFTFSNVQSITKKIDLFFAQAKDSIKNALKRKGGKPPRGIIVTVWDARGREKTESSRLDFVVNLESILKFIKDMLERMKEDFMEWKDMEESGEPTDDLDISSSENYNPDTIAGITLKLIY